jgi:hypothetical protein
MFSHVSLLVIFYFHCWLSCSPATTPLQEELRYWKPDCILDLSEMYYILLGQVSSVQLCSWKEVDWVNQAALLVPSSKMFCAQGPCNANSNFSNCLSPILVLGNGKHCASAVQALCKRCASTVQALCKHCASTMQALCKHYASTVQAGVSVDGHMPRQHHPIYLFDGVS